MDNTVKTFSDSMKVMNPCPDGHDGEAYMFGGFLSGSNKTYTIIMNQEGGSAADNG